MAERRGAYVYADVLGQHVLREDHPMRPARLRYTYELLEGYGAFDSEGSRLVPPRQATEEEVRSFHTAEYIQAVQALSLREHCESPARFSFSDRGDNPPYPGMYDAALWSTGASVVAAELVASGEVGVAFNTSGGLHHAAPDHAAGFCVFNDPVIAINGLVARGIRVAYVDIDAHHGDGVQNAFYDSDRVLTISLHESGEYLFPGTGFVEEMGVGQGDGYSVNVPLFPYTGDDVYVWAMEQVVPPLLKAFHPDVLATQLGIDTYVSDPLTHLALTTRGYERAVQMLADLELPWLAFGGGGYDLGAVARCWTLAYGIMAGREWPDEIPEVYRQRYGVTTLRDAECPSADESLQRQARRYAEETVASVQRRIFPRHGLSRA